jgi:hypothetical protein
MTYVQPSKQIKIDKFDYANPDGLQETFDIGLTDGIRFAEENTVTARRASSGSSSSPN